MFISNKTQTDNLSLEYFLALPEATPASEYINGKIYQKPIPKGKHSLLQGRLSETINKIGVPTKVAYSFPELRCSFNQRSIVADIVVFEWANIPLDDEGEISNEIIAFLGLMRYTKGDRAHLNDGCIRMAIALI